VFRDYSGETEGAMSGLSANIGAKLGRIARGLFVPVLVSLFGAIYSAVKGVPYWYVILWALLNAAIVIWSGKSFARKALDRPNLSHVEKAGVALVFITLIAVPFIAANLAVYFVARGIIK